MKRPATDLLVVPLLLVAAVVMLAVDALDRLVERITHR